VLVKNQSFHPEAALILAASNFIFSLIEEDRLFNTLAALSQIYFLSDAIQDR